MPTYEIETPDGAYEVDADHDLSQEELQGLATHVSSPAPHPERSWGQAVTGGAIRVGSTVLGSVAGGIPGAMLGAGLGDVAARYATGEPQDLPESALQAGLAGLVPAVVPAAGPAATLARRVIQGAAEGGAQAAVQTGAHSVITTGEAPGAGELIGQTAFGMVLGGGAHAVLGTIRPPQSVNEEIEHAAGHRIYGETDTGPPAALTASEAEAAGVTPAPPEPELPEVKQARVQRMVERVDDIYHAAPEEQRAAIKQTILDNQDAMYAQTRGQVPIAEIEGNATKIDIDPELIVAPGTAVNAEHMAAQKAVVNAGAARVAQLREQYRLDPENAALGDDLVAAERQMYNTHLAFQGYGSEAGRSLGYLSHQRAPLHPEAERAARVTKFAQSIRPDVTADEISDAVSRGGSDPNRVYQELINLGKPTWLQQGRSLYLVNLMTGPGTLERNAFGSVITMARDLATKPVAAAIDAPVALFTGRERTHYASETPLMVAGAAKAVPDAFRAFFQVMKQGFTDTEARDLLEGVGFKGDFTHPLAPVPGPHKYVSRFLQGTDSFFRLLFTGMQKDGALLAEAINRVKQAQGKDFSMIGSRREVSAMAADLARAPESVPGLLEGVRRAADRSLFVEKEIGPLQTVAHAINRVPVLGPMVSPFVTIGANMSRQSFQFSPVGVFMKGSRQGGPMSKELLQSVGKAGAARLAGREQMQRIAETVLGSTIMGGLVWLAAEGHISGTAPTGQGKKDAFLAKHPENAAKIGDVWYRTGDLGVLNVPVAAAANFVEAFRNAGTDPTEHDAATLVHQVMAGMAKTGNSLFQQSFFSAVGDFFDAVKSDDPDKWGDFMSRRVTSLVPFQGTLRAVTNATDPYVRKPQTAEDRAKAIIPGQSGTLPPRLDAFGQPVKREPPGPGNLLIDIPGVHGGVTREEDPVRTGLEKHGIMPAPANSARSYQLGTRTIVVDPESDFAMRQAKGWLKHAAVAREIASPYYARATPDVQARRLKSQLSQASEQVTARAKEFLRRGQRFSADDLVPAFARQ